MTSESQNPQVSRRHMLQLLGALGITGPAAAEIVAQSRAGALNPDILRSANAVTGLDLSDERLKIAATALQRNLEQFQMIRDLEIDDSIEPATLFHAKGR